MALIIPQAQPSLAKPVIFLDIDGVLNHLDVYDKREPYINRDNMNALNVLLDETGANLVISSAWRYLITEKLMTVEGFHHMLVTHGLGYNRHIIGKTVPDGGEFGQDRGAQIRHWMETTFRYHLGGPTGTPWVAIDDTEMPTLPAAHVVYTLPHQGLRSHQVSEAIEKLKAQGLNTR